MELWTIGAFARASRLSPKALRLYDELGLLIPAHVDPVNGYRRYAPEQLERARLVVWLRRLGMPLGRIREVCALDASAAAEAVRVYWVQVEAETAARRDLAVFLVDHLNRRDCDMSAMTMQVEIRYAALSDTGLVRRANQDTAYAGPRLLAVADGFGGAGAPAGAAAVEALKPFDGEGVPAGALLNALDDMVEQVGCAVRGVGEAGGGNGSDADGAGTTLTALLLSGSQLALVHIGDSRAYVLRDGELRQITHDHTMVRAMVDEGRLSEEEAAAHPQRALLTRALTAGGAGGGGRTGAGVPETKLHDARAGDRYLVCSDGLSAVVPGEELGDVLRAGGAPEETARELVALAHRFGGPDNVSCVVADVVERAA
ncbi:MerR family transcriptional regulator [Streptomyces sp. TR02-1]|uniref:MerR family transcriptional regulator n=1 Tax=Streptomyces sp. TR02-1 TaxID=3385977 RepID=UPI0039A1EC58